MDAFRHPTTKIFFSIFSILKPEGQEPPSYDPEPAFYVGQLISLLNVIHLFGIFIRVRLVVCCRKVCMEDLDSVRQTTAPDGLGADV